MVSLSRRRVVLPLRIGRLKWGAVCLAVLIAGGCGAGTSEIPDTRYFVIDYKTPAAAKSGAMLPVTVGVDSFRSDSVYRTDRIVYRKVPYRVDFYPYERWGARPEEFVTDRMLDHLQASGRFKEVVRTSGGISTDYLVRGRVKRFEEVDSPDGKFSAMAQVEISLVERRSGKVLFQRLLSESTEAKSQPPQGFVEAMVESLRRLLGQAAGQVAEAVARQEATARP